MHPTTGVLDNFNRADGGLGSNWSTVQGTPAVSSNQAAGGSAGANVALWTPATFTTPEIYATLPVVAQFTQIGWLDGSFNGYGIGVGATGLQVQRFNGGAPTNLGAIFTVSLGNGDAIGLSLVDGAGTLRAWHKPVGGPWTLLGTRTDTSHTGASSLFVSLFDTTARLDDLSGGAFVPPPWTEVNTTAGGENVRILVPDATPNDRAIVIFHPYGGVENITESPTLYQLLLALSGEGYTIAASSLGGETWGNQDALDANAALLSLLAGTYDITGVVSLGTSAGGIAALNEVVLEDPAMVKGVLGISMAVDLDAIYVDNPSGVADSIDDAYPSGFTGFDPIHHSASAYAGRRYLLFASTTDTIVPKTDHADAFATLVTGHAAEIAVQTISGSHAEAELDSGDIDDVLDFLDRAFLAGARRRRRVLLTAGR